MFFLGRSTCLLIFLEILTPAYRRLYVCHGVTHKHSREFNYYWHLEVSPPQCKWIEREKISKYYTHDTMTICTPNLTALTTVHNSAGCNWQWSGCSSSSWGAPKVISFYTRTKGYTPIYSCPHQITGMHQGKRCILLRCIPANGKYWITSDWLFQRLGLLGLRPKYSAFRNLPGVHHIHKNGFTLVWIYYIIGKRWSIILCYPPLSLSVMRW